MRFVLARAGTTYLPTTVLRWRPVRDCRGRTRSRLRDHVPGFWFIRLLRYRQPMTRLTFCGSYPAGSPLQPLDRCELRR